MGNSKSRLNFKKSTPGQLPIFDSTSLDESLDEEKLDYYLSVKACDSDMLHMNTNHLFQSYFTSPIEDKLIQGECKVLDVGCGPGTWLLCMSNKYENSNFIGLDIKPLFPQEINPNNLADIFDGLPFPDNEFDFVHEETMAFIFTREQWEFVLSELISKPGGYIELAEGFATYIDSGPIFNKFHQAIYSKQNVDMKLVNSLDLILGSHSNIITVNRDERMVIFGPNGGKAGLIIQDIFALFCTTGSAIEVLSTELEMSKEEYKNGLEKDLMEELKQTSPEILIIRFWTQKN